MGVIAIGCAAERADAKPTYLAAFRVAYPEAVGSRIDACTVCHSAVPQLNPYGSAYSGAGRVFASIEDIDSDGDGVLNLAELVALTFPGDAADFPALPTPTPTATSAPATPTPTATSVQATPTPTATPVQTTATPTATPESGPCAGDCNANGVVTVNEVLRAVNIALGSASVDVCVSVDRDGNGAVSISELLRAVRAALDGCP